MTAAQAFLIGVATGGTCLILLGLTLLVGRREYQPRLGRVEQPFNEVDELHVQQAIAVGNDEPLLRTVPAAGGER